MCFKQGKKTKEIYGHIYFHFIERVENLIFLPVNNVNKTKWETGEYLSFSVYAMNHDYNIKYFMYFL